MPVIQPGLQRESQCMNELILGVDGLKYAG